MRRPGPCLPAQALFLLLVWSGCGRGSCCTSLVQLHRRLLQGGSEGCRTDAECRDQDGGVHVVEVDVIDKECVVMQNTWFDEPLVPAAVNTLLRESPLECCKACFQAEACSVWTYCTQEGGCAMPGSPARELPFQGCRLVALPNFHPVVNQSTSFRVLGPSVPFMSGAPIELTLPKVPGYQINAGVDLNSKYDYACPQSLWAGLCEVVGTAQELANICNLDPKCKGFVYLPNGLDFKSAPLGLLKGGENLDTIPLSALAVNPSTALFLKDTVVYTNSSRGSSGSSGSTNVLYIALPISLAVALVAVVALVVIRLRSRMGQLTDRAKLEQQQQQQGVAEGGAASPAMSSRAASLHVSASSGRNAPGSAALPASQQPGEAATEAGGVAKLHPVGGLPSEAAARQRQPSPWMPGEAGHTRQALSGPLVWQQLATVRNSAPLALQHQWQGRHPSTFHSEADVPLVLELLRRFGEDSTAAGAAFRSGSDVGSSNLQCTPTLGSSSSSSSSRGSGDDTALLAGLYHAAASSPQSSLEAPGTPHPPLRPAAMPLQGQPQLEHPPGSSQQQPSQHGSALLGQSVPPGLQGGASLRSLASGLSAQGSMQLPALPWSDWVVRPEEVEVCLRPDGSWWQLGSGAFGTVYKGLYHGVQPVAVKVLHADTDPRVVEEFVKEITLLKSFRDRNIVQFLGASLDGPVAMLVTEFMELGDLWRALPLRTISGDRIFAWNRRGRRVALDVARGLHYLHHKRVVHLDLKSANILLSRHGTAKICDVGFSRVLTREYVSMFGGATGTFAWSAPEVLAGKRCTEKVDVFSFGIVLWEICTGEVPVRGGMRPLSVPQDCPQEVADLQAWCTAESPEDRPDAAELVRHLASLV